MAARPEVRTPVRRWRTWVTCALAVLLAMGANAFYFNQYRVTVHSATYRRIIVPILRPFLGRIVHVDHRIVWTRVENGIPGYGPWHRDLLLVVVGSRPSPWGGPITYDVYINGQGGGIAAWFVAVPLKGHPPGGRA